MRTSSRAAARQDLQAVCRDGQELDVVALQEDHHLLEAAGKPDRHLGALLVEQQVVKGGDGVEKKRHHGGTARDKTVPNEYN